jgi:hypothetical protein
MGNIFLNGIVRSAKPRKKVSKLGVPTLSEAEGEGSAVRRKNRTVGNK